MGVIRKVCDKKPDVYMKLSLILFAYPSLSFYTALNRLKLMMRALS